MTWHYFDLSTGILQGRTFRCSDPSIKPPDIAGLGVIEGVTDWESQRVDLATLQVVDYQPPPPDDDHEWIHDDERGRVRRWVVKASVAERKRRASQILDELRALDERLIRPLGELALGSIADDDLAAAAAQFEQQQAARQAVAEINNKKQALRLEFQELQRC